MSNSLVELEIVSYATTFYKASTTRKIHRSFLQRNPKGKSLIEKIQCYEKAFREIEKQDLELYEAFQTMIVYYVHMFNSGRYEFQDLVLKNQIRTLFRDKRLDISNNNLNDLNHLNKFLMDIEYFSSARMNTEIIIKNIPKKKSYLIYKSKQILQLFDYRVVNILKQNDLI